MTRVYDGDQVDEYVDRLHAHIDELEDRLKRAGEQGNTILASQGLATQGLDADDASASVLGRALLHAQRLADEALADAMRERDRLDSDASSARERLTVEARRHAEDVRAQAQGVAEELIAVARVEADRIIGDGRQVAESLLTDARREAEKILAGAHFDAEQLVAGARVQADEILAAVKQHADDIHAVAEATRHAAAIVREQGGSHDAWPPPAVSTEQPVPAPRVPPPLGNDDESAVRHLRPVLHSLGGAPAGSAVGAADAQAEAMLAHRLIPFPWSEDGGASRAAPAPGPPPHPSSLSDIEPAWSGDHYTNGGGPAPLDSPPQLQRDPWAPPPAREMRIPSPYDVRPGAQPDAHPERATTGPPTDHDAGGPAGFGNWAPPADIPVEPAEPSHVAAAPPHGSHQSNGVHRQSNGGHAQPPTRIVAPPPSGAPVIPLVQPPPSAPSGRSRPWRRRDR